MTFIKSKRSKNKNTFKQKNGNGEIMAKSIESIVGEELKDEIYRITEIAINEKLQNLEKRISELEMLKAELVEVQNDLKRQVAEIKKMVIADKKTSSERLTEIEKMLDEILGKLKAISEEMKKRKKSKK